MEKPTDHEELQVAIAGDRYRILALLAEHETLPSGTIRDRTAIPEGSKHYQLSLLESWNLIEPVGNHYVGEHKTGIPATVYTLTDEGYALVKDHNEQTDHR